MQMSQMQKDNGNKPGIPPKQNAVILPQINGLSIISHHSSIFHHSTEQRGMRSLTA